MNIDQGRRALIVDDSVGVFIKTHGAVRLTHVQYSGNVHVACNPNVVGLENVVPREEAGHIKVNPRHVEKQATSLLVLFNCWWAGYHETRFVLPPYKLPRSGQTSQYHIQVLGSGLDQ